MIRAELLINMHSRRSREALPSILDACKKHGIELTETHRVDDVKELHRTLRNVRRRNPALLLVGGGDGTVSDAVDYLVGSDVALGVLPLGTTNNFARSLALPLDIDGAVAAIKHGRVRNVDLGKIGSEYFANVIGIGLSAQVAARVSDKRKKYLGRLAYGITGIEQLIRHKPFYVTVQDKDHALQLNLETHQLIVANGRYHAGREIAREARLDNRELIIFALGGRRRLSLIWHIIDFYLGKRGSVQHASYIVGSNVLISTSKPQPAELDGEIKATTPIAVEVKAAAIKVRH